MSILNMLYIVFKYIFKTYLLLLSLLLFILILSFGANLGEEDSRGRIIDS
jgi:hypothetical protein